MTLRIVCIGDSIAAGQYLPDNERPWPALLRAVDVVAAAVSSDTTRLGLERFPRDVQLAEADAVVIQFGHNDCNRWTSDRWLPRVSADAYAANLAEMVMRARTFDAIPFLCTLTPSHKSEQHADDVSRYDQILREVARAEGVGLVDVRTIFQVWEQDEPHISLLLPDGLHLAPVGHRVYASAVQQKLDEWARSRAVEAA